MSYAAERATIETYFQTEWADYLPVGYDDEPFTAAIDTVQLNILDGKSLNKSEGSPGTNLVRYTGIVAFRIYTNADNGTARSREIEDRISDIFRNHTEGNIHFGAPYVSGTVKEAPLRVRTLMVPFNRDELHG